MKIAYLNVNCVAGFKFFEMKSLILEGAFDVFVLAETKIDEANTLARLQRKLEIS